MSALPFEGERRPAEAIRWGAAALLVTGLHVGAGWWLLQRALPTPPPPEGTTGVIIDLEPVAVPATAPAVPRPPVLAGEAPAAAGPPSEPPPQAEATPVPTPAPPPPDVEPAPRPEPAPPQPVVPAPETPVPADAPAPPAPTERPLPVPPVPPKPKAAVARPKSRPAKAEVRKPDVAKPAVARPDVARPDLRRGAREAERRQARADARAARADARAARAGAAWEGGGQPAEAAAPRPAASGAEVASWRGAVVAHLNAYKPASPSGAGGTVRVAFAVDRGGRVTSASVSGSSGDPSLDAAAVAMVRRASPVPAPPPELGGRIALAVPVRFH